MNKILIKQATDEINKYKTMFNNGDNDGDVIIVCENDIEIKAHSEVLEKTSEYFRGVKLTFETEKKLYLLEYNDTIVKSVINMLYYSKYNELYFCEWENMCIFFELIEILLLDPILNETIDSIYNDYIICIRNDKDIIGNERSLESFYFDIIDYVSSIDSKYFVRFNRDLCTMFMAKPFEDLVINI